MLQTPLPSLTRSCCLYNWLAPSLLRQNGEQQLSGVDLASSAPTNCYTWRTATASATEHTRTLIQQQKYRYITPSTFFNKKKKKNLDALHCTRFFFFFKVFWHVLFPSFNPGKEKRKFWRRNKERRAILRKKDRERVSFGDKEDFGCISVGIVP